LGLLINVIRGARAKVDLAPLRRGFFFGLLATERNFLAQKRKTITAPLRLMDCLRLTLDDPDAPRLLDRPVLARGGRLTCN